MRGDTRIDQKVGAALNRPKLEQVANTSKRWAQIRAKTHRMIKKPILSPENILRIEDNFVDNTAREDSQQCPCSPWLLDSR